MSEAISTDPVAVKPVLKPDQIVFLNDLGGTAGESLAKGAKQEKQRALITSVTAELANGTDAIKSAQTFELIEQNTGVVGMMFDLVSHQTTVNSFDLDADPNKEFEAGDAVMSRFKELDPVVVQEVMKAQKRIVDLQNKLRETMEDGGTAEKDPEGKNRPDGYKPVPMFGADEIDSVIAAEIWQPLVRGRIIPENAVPDRYSEVNQTFKGASDEYQKRLTKYTGSASLNDDAIRQAALAKTVFDGMNTISSSVMDVLADQFPAGNAAKMIKEIQGIQTLIADLGAVAFGVTDAVLKQEFDPSIMTTALKPILSGIKLDGDSSPAHVAELTDIKLGVSLALQSVTVIGYMAKRDPDKAINTFAKVLSTGIASMDGGGSKYYANIGADIVASATVVTGIKTAAVAAKGGDYPAAVEALCKSVAAVTTDVVNQAIQSRIAAADKSARAGTTESSSEKSALNKKRDKEIADQQAAYAKIVEATTAAPGAIAAVLANEGKIRELLEKQAKPAELKDVQTNWAKLSPEQQAKIIKMQRNEVALQMEDEAVQLKGASADFAKLTQSTDPSDMDRLIAAVKLQQARYTLALKLASLPFAAIGAMFPPAKMGQSLLELANEMRLLIDCGQQYMSWAENMDDARRAGSVQAEAMSSRMDLSMTQSVRHGVESAIKVAQIIGQGLTIAGGPLAHAGLMLDKTAAGASAAKKVISAVVDEHAAAAGWRIYQKAFENPKNRTAARQALRQNPTLAKYAIAYGAKVGNPIAANALRKCGITDEMMADKNAGVAKLVTFLEARFNEDPTILRRITKSKWYPGTIELTAASWMEFVTAAEEDAKLAPLPTSSLVVAALTSLEQDRKAFEDAGDNVTLDQAKRLLGRLPGTRKVIAGIKPVDTDDEPHKEFLNYLEGLRALIDAEIASVAEMEKILANDESTFQHILKSFTPLRLEVSALQPAPQSQLAKDRLAFQLSLDGPDGLDALAKGPDWQAALVAVKAAKIAANKLLDDNLDLETKLDDELKALTPLLQQARDAQPDTPPVQALKKDLKTLTEKIAQTQQAETWDQGLNLLTQAKDKANEILDLVM
jgi:hypothetical protein